MFNLLLVGIVGMFFVNCSETVSNTSPDDALSNSINHPTDASLNLNKDDDGTGGNNNGGTDDDSNDNSNNNSGGTDNGSGSTTANESTSIELNMVSQVRYDGMSDLNLDQAQDFATAEVGDTNYLFVSGLGADGVSVFSVDADGKLENVHNLDDDYFLQLDGATSVAVGKIQEITFFFVAGIQDNGVSIFRVENNGTLINVLNITTDIISQLEQIIIIDTVQVGENFFFFTGSIINGITVFEVDENLDVFPAKNENYASMLNGLSSITTAEVNGRTYLFASAVGTSTISVFELESDGKLRHIENVSDSDGSNLQLEDANAVTTGKVGKKTYLFAKGIVESGISVFRVDGDQGIENIHNVIHDDLDLSAAWDLTTVEVDNITYLFVGGVFNNRMNIFRVKSDGNLVYLNAGQNQRPIINSKTATIGDKVYLFTSPMGLERPEVNVFHIKPE